MALSLLGATFKAILDSKSQTKATFRIQNLLVFTNLGFIFESLDSMLEVFSTLYAFKESSF